MDQLTPEESHLIPAFLVGPMTRMGERVAASEARFTAEISALKEDTRTIRHAVHSINNALHVAGIAERQSAIEIAKLSEKVGSSAELLTSKMAATAEQLDSLATKVDVLTVAKNHVEGGWWAMVKGAAILTGIASAAGAISTLAWWIVQHIKI